MAKPPELRCPGVRDMIAQVEELDAHGDCWCKCVKDDVPKAKELASRGFCMGAMKVIRAARARCTSHAEKLRAGTAAPDFKPIRPMTLTEMMASGKE